MKYLNKLIALSRWKEHMPFTLPLSLFGYCVGLTAGNASFNLIKFLLIFIATSLAISFAFIINEIEDAEDDKENEGKQNNLLFYSLELHLYVFGFNLACLTNLAFVAAISKLIRYPALFRQYLPLQFACAKADGSIFYYSD